MPERGWSRRALLATLGAGLSATVGGCAGGSGGAPPNERDGTTTPEPEPAEPTTSAERPSSVVERRGTSFVLDGARYVFSGVANCCIAEGYTSRERVDDTLEAAASLDADVIRFKVGSAGGESTCGSAVDGCDVTFQPRPGEFSEVAFEHLDYILAEAGARGMRVVLPLVDNWGDTGMERYVGWADDGDRGFYASAEAQSLYRRFVEALLTRTNTITDREYRADPTVLAWELANEPRPRAGGEGLLSWVRDTSAFLREIGVDQLVSTGSDHLPPDLYTRVHDVDGIDACSIHLWPQNWDEPEPAAFGREYIADRVRRGHETVGKPVYLGEYGWRVNLQADDVVDQIARRNALFAAWHEAALDADMDGLLAWELLSDGRLRYHRTEWGRGRTVGFACPEHAGTCDVLRSVARRVDRGSDADG